MQVINTISGRTSRTASRWATVSSKKADGRRIVEAADMLRQEGRTARRGPAMVFSGSRPARTRSGRRRPAGIASGI